MHVLIAGLYAAVIWLSCIAYAAIAHPRAVAAVLWCGPLIFSGAIAGVMVLDWLVGLALAAVAPHWSRAALLARRCWVALSPARRDAKLAAHPTLVAANDEKESAAVPH